jgi:hypothetical protein
VRIPLLSGPADRPLAWWEWLFAPVVYPVAFLAMLVYGVASIPYTLVYPESRFHLYDMGTERQVELMRRYRRLAARVPLWRRVGRALAFPFGRRRTRLYRRRA